MTTYKGYYIDGAIFASKADIDNFLKEQAIRSFKNSVESFAHHPSIEASMWQTGKAENLVNNYGYTWAQVEALEIEVLRTVR